MMQPTLRLFVQQYLGTVCAALMPVVMTAFFSIPFALNGHPGDAVGADAVVESHMT
jgi:hypothetical protein